MEILAFICGVDITLFALIIFALYKGKQPKNKVYFYIARDKDEILWLYLGKPIRENEIFNKRISGNIICSTKRFKEFGLNIDDYKDLRWEDEPVEVFLNLKE